MNALILAEDRPGNQAKTDLSDLLADDPPSIASNLAVALDLARRAFKVFPITLKAHGGWTPIVGWQAAATTDAATIRRWFAETPDARLGLPTGAANGVTVLDVDEKDGKSGTLSLLVEGFGDIAALSALRVRTPSGGWHLYFAHEPSLKNSVGKIGEGLDVRNDGGYVLAPGSSKNGQRYTVEGEALGAVELPPFPAALMPPAAQEREPVTVQATASDAQKTWAGNHLAKLADDLSALGAGEGRNDALNAAAIWAGGAAFRGFIDRASAHSVLASACEANGLTRREFEATFESGWKAGLKKPIAEFPRDWGPDDFDDLEPPPALFEIASTWAASPAPAREWLVEGLIPSGVVTMINGDGGTGKSLLALQLAVATASGGPWIGRAIDRPGKAMFLSAEDSKDELHRRLEGICGDRLGSLDRLLIRSFVDADPLLATFDKQNAIRVTILFEQIESTMERERPALIVLDTLADLHTGDENNRSHARQFIGKLKALASRFDCAVLLLAHPSRSGMADGTGASGSTGWNNSVRSRLYLTRVIDADGREWDDKAREISTVKANYGARGEMIDLRWQDGAFVATGDGFDDLETRSAKAERVFLKLLDRFTAEGRYVSCAQSPTYAPAQFVREPDAEGCSRDDLEGAMRRLFHQRIICSGEHRSKSRLRTHIERAPSDAIYHNGELLV